MQAVTIFFFTIFLLNRYSGLLTVLMLLEEPPQAVRDTFLKDWKMYLLMCLTTAV